MDQLDLECPGIPFSWEAEEWRENNNNNNKDEEFIVNFFPFISTILLLFLSDDVCLISPAEPLPLHPLDVTCKDNSQKFKKNKNILAVNLCKEIVAKKGIKET